jgi:hypothetical protein
MISIDGIPTEVAVVADRIMSPSGVAGTLALTIGISLAFAFLALDMVE